MVNKRKQTSAIFSALADPTRQRILEHLSAHGESRVTELARPFRISLPAVSKHLKVLEGAHLVRRHRKGREHLIRADVAGLKGAQDWISRFVAGWEFSFNSLEKMLKREAGARRTDNEI